MKKKGFSFVEIMIVIAIIGLLAAIAIPSFVRANQTKNQNICLANLREIDAAKEQYRIENNIVNNSPCALENIDSYVKGGVGSLFCPSDASRTFNTSYDINTIGEDPACKIFKKEHAL